MWLPSHYELEFNCQHPMNRTDKPLASDRAANALAILRGHAA